jgi:hypothetical protein
MSFLNRISEFISLCKELSFDIVKIYEQDPDGIYVSILVLLVLLLIIIFLIRRSFKISSAVKLVSKIQDSKDFNDYDSKLTKLVTELPKRGLKVANSINIQKDEILKQELLLLKDFDIKEKISKYKQMSAQYSLMAQNSKKFKIEELTSFYEEKSKTLLDKNLADEIKEYYKDRNFNENDVQFVNSIAKYANTTSDPSDIINPLQKEIDRFSYGYNLDLFKFIKGLDKQYSLQVFENCTAKMNDLLSDEEGKISEKILNYMLEKDEKEKVYKYISNLKSSEHLKALYNNMFSKTEDINLDLAFVSNETEICNEYKKHIDNKITENWKDLGYIKYIIQAPRVLETIGHIDYRNVLERIEKLETEEENNKAIAEALRIARRAEEIANEAKALARQK